MSITYIVSLLEIFSFFVKDEFQYCANREKIYQIISTVKQRKELKKPIKEMLILKKSMLNQSEFF